MPANVNPLPMPGKKNGKAEGRLREEVGKTGRKAKAK
jgi:hypothetical protein